MADGYIYAVYSRAASISRTSGKMPSAKMLSFGKETSYTRHNKIQRQQNAIESFECLLTPQRVERMKKKKKDFHLLGESLMSAAAELRV